MIRNFERGDLSSVVEIFNYYVKHNICTFQLKALSQQEMLDKIDNVTLNYPFLVIQIDKQVVGFAYGSQWRQKQAYKKSVETTIYIKPDVKSKGLGHLLYTRLMDELQKQGFHLVVACVTLPNMASVALHERLGFEKVGIFSEAGRKFDQWHDVGFWQKRLG